MACNIFLSLSEFDSMTLLFDSTTSFYIYFGGFDVGLDSTNSVKFDSIFVAGFDSITFWCSAP